MTESVVQKEHNFVSSAKPNVPVSDTSVAVAATLTTILTIDTKHSHQIGVEITETGGANALDQFVINARFHGGGAYSTLYNASADFTSPSGLMVGASSDLTALAASATGCAW